MTAFTLAIQMAIFMTIGFAARKKRIVEDRFSTSLAGFIFNFVFPCVVIKAIAFQSDYNPSQIRNSGSLILTSIVSMFILLGFGILVNKISGKDDDMSRIMLVNLMFTNFTYMAFPIMESLYGDVGSFYIAIYTIPVRVMFYVATPLIFTVRRGGEFGGWKKIGRDIVRALLSPPVVAVPIGMLILFAHIPIPKVFSGVVISLAAVATPMGMILCGVTLAAIPLSKIWKENRLILITILRLIAAPALILGIYLASSHFMTWDPIVAKVCILYCALPAAATTTVMAIKAQSDATKAAQCVFLTTIMSVLTLPVWVLILDHIVK